jgi:hypothetical protein
MDNNIVKNNIDTSDTEHRRTDNRTEDKSAMINGWGIDADRENDPTYPMKERTDEEQKGYSWNRPTQQPVNIEVLRSIERPNVSAVYGTSTPPQGLSGQIRRFAFKYSESTYAHWFPLAVADRVNVIEGIVDDLKKGIVPNIFVEKGWKAEWKYNKKGLITKVLVTAAITYGVVKLLSRKDRD